MEQNELLPNELFRLFEKAAPEHLEAAEHGHHLTYRGRHRGYARLPQPVVHERGFTLSRTERLLTIVDVLAGEGTHRIRWHFHFAPGVEASIAPGGDIEIHAGTATLSMTIPAGARATLGAAWYSPSYGVRLACACLDLEIEERIDGRREYMFHLKQRAQDQSAVRTEQPRAASR